MDIYSLLMVPCDLDLQLRSAADHGNDSEVTRLLEENANINSCSEHGVTALHLATAAGHHHIVEMLIDSEAHLDTTNQNGQTALHLAALRGDLDMIELLVDAGSDINTTTQFSQMSALHLASKEGHADVCRHLLSHGCDINITDQIDKPAYHYAANDEIRLMLRTKKLRKEPLADQYSRKIYLDTANANFNNTIHDDFPGENTSSRSQVGNNGSLFDNPPVTVVKQTVTMPPTRRNSIQAKPKKMSSASGPKINTRRQSIKFPAKKLTRKKSVKKA